MLRIETASIRRETVKASPPETPSSVRLALDEQLLDDFARIGNLHRPTALARKGCFERNVKRLADARHHVL